MSFDFFAYLNRMKYIERWSLMHSTVKENVMEHSAGVAMIAHALGVINNVVFAGDADPDRCAAIAVFHESAEVITGDLPTPIKYYNDDIRNAYKNIEGIAEARLLSTLPEAFRKSYEPLVVSGKGVNYTLVKAADKIAAYLKCVEELKYGNKEFLKAKNATLKAIRDMGLPEVDYFFDNFVKGYEKTLDEME